MHMPLFPGLRQVRLLNPATDRPQCVAFDVQGRFLAVGTTSGRVLILDPHVLTDTQKPLSHGSGTIVDIKFSSDGIFMATADSDRYVALYRFMPTPVPKSIAGGGLGKTTKPWEAAAEAEVSCVRGPTPSRLLLFVVVVGIRGEWLLWLWSSHVLVGCEGWSCTGACFVM